MSTNQHSRSCVLVGEGNLLIECGLLLRQAGVRIGGVISDDVAVLQWAHSLRLPTIGHGADVVAWLERSPFDYLLSVINLRILPVEALQLPRIAAINFHDGPLPRYAGLIAPSWALFNGEKTYGITWHLMESTIDTGAIVRQRWFDVTADETALSLNLKCFKEGLAALAELVPDLMRGVIAATPQDFALRTYYAGSRRPVAGGVLNWSRHGEESEAMARGTDFGPYFNPLVLPKIWTGTDFLVASDVGLAGLAASAPPGAVLAMDDALLTIATASRPVTVGRLATIDGESLSVAEAARRYQLHVGRVLPLLEVERGEQLTQLNETLSRHERFWADRLQSLCPVTLGRTPHAAPAARIRALTSQAWHVPKEVDAWLERRAHRWQQREFLLAAFGAFLARLGVHDTFDVEFHDDGSQPEDPTGVFAEHVPFRFDIDDDFGIVLERVREELARIAHRKTYPRDLVPRSPSLRSRPELLSKSKLPLAVEFGSVGNRSDSGHDLVMRFPFEGSEGFAVFGDACLDSMPAMVQRFSTFVRNLAISEGVSLRGIPLVSEEERHILLEQWGTAGGADESTDCLHELFDAQASRTPDAVALQSGSVELTYREVRRRADSLAARLRRLDVGPDVPVGICLGRSSESIVGILGILKAGGAYVPLDPAYPRHRLAFIVNDSGMRAVVTTRDLAVRVPSGAMARVYLDADAASGVADESFEPVAVTHRNLAYIIYTSGSTGEPKGVMVEHRAVVNFTKAAQARYTLRPVDRVLQFASLNFDASVEEIFPCLTSGGTLVLRNDEMLASARVFLEQCAAWRITVLDLPTAYWHVLVMQMQESGLPPCPALRVVIIGGEAASPAQVAAWREMAGPRIALFNTYGPTEATVVSTWVDVGDREVRDEVPIGVPIAGATAYVLDRWGQPLPHGVMGQLHIGGAGLARGYLNRPELTAERFVPDQFHSAPGGRLYRTGDLCSWRSDGMLVFHGRIDDQVKIRGHRIELSEIEAALMAVPGIRQAAVTAHEVKPGDARLVAYVAEVAGGVADDAIRHRLSQALPDFMMPAAFIRLESLPLNPSGKIDRRSLPVPDLQRPSDVPCVMPRTPLEKQLAGVWCNLLSVDSIGVDDDFFHSGGESLVAMELVATVRQIWGVELPLRQLFERRTIAGLAAFIASATVLREETVASPTVPQAGDSPVTIPANGTSDMPASAAQQGMFLTHGLSPDPATYNESFMFRTTAPVDWRRVRAAIGAIMDRHPALRTALVMGDDRLVQRIAAPGSVDIPWSEATLLRAEGVEREQTITEMLRAEARRPFDLGLAPLWRVILVEDAHQGDSILLFVFHHSVIDDWSLRVVFEELSKLTMDSVDDCGEPARRNTVAPALPFAAMMPAEPVLARHREFWREELCDPPSGPRWLTDTLRPPVATGRGAWQRFTIDAETVRSLRALASQEYVTLFTVMLAACHAWLHRISGDDDIVVGTPVADRRRSDAQAQVGLFLNTLPIRLRWQDQPGGNDAGLGAGGFRDVVCRVRDAFHAAVEHVDLPFEQIVEVAARGRPAGRQPLFRVLFALLEQPLPGVSLGGIVVHSTPVGTGTSKFDLTLFMVVVAGELQCRFEYATDIFDEPAIITCAEQFVSLVRHIAVDPLAPLDTISLLTPAERRLVTVEFNRSAGPPAPMESVHEQFDSQAHRAPDAVALAWDGGAWTFRELKSRADRLADRLRELGVLPDVPVGLFVERSPDLFVGLLGILKAGGCYVPMDPVLPASRLAFLLADSGCPVVVAASALLPGLRHAVAEARAATASPDAVCSPVVLLLDDDSPVPLHSDGELTRGSFTVNQLAYVLYTSGSTGQPKGVAMPHGPLVNLLAWQAATSCMGPGNRTLQFASPGFDVSFQEIFSTWLSGGTLVLVAEHARRDPSALLAAIDRDGIDRLFLPVVMLDHLAEAAEACQLFPQSLREVIVAGEQLRITPAIRQFFKHLPACRLWNHYGPTETHVATGYLLPADPSSWPDLPSIGRPIANTQVYLLDRHREPVPRGVAGDLWIGGAAVARGYWRRPELTAERFVADPFTDDPPARLYRTGDRGRWRMDGQLEFLGRTDHQVKIRGHRVELGEIEAVLATHPEVRSVAAVVRGDAGAARSIVAFVVCHKEAALQPAEVRSWLRGRLPEPCVPSRVVMLPALPLNASGKVDRKALEGLAAAQGRGDDAADDAGDSVGFERPDGERETLLASLWQSLLAVDRIGRHDDFFALGGTSLLAMRLVARARDALTVQATVRDVFECPTLAGLATRWAPRRPLGQPPGDAAIPARRTGSSTTLAAGPRVVAASAAQRRLWFLQQYAPDSPVYTIADAHVVRGPLDVAALVAALNRIVLRHESLRTTLTFMEGEVVASVAEASTWPLVVIDASGATSAEREADAIARLVADYQRPFALEHGPLVRGCVVRLSPEEHVVALFVHHAIFDGWSMGVFHGELAACYEAWRDRREPALKTLTIQYADFAAWQTQWSRDGEAVEQEDYWRRQLSHAPAHLDLPTDKARPSAESFRGAMASRPLEPAVVDGLAMLTQREACTPFMVLLTTFAAVLARWCDVEDMVVGTPMADRTRRETTAMIGCLVNTLAIRIDLSDNPSFRQLLARVRTTVLGAFAHADLPFDRVVELLETRRDAVRAPVFQVMFAWQDESDAMMRLPGLQTESLPFDGGVSHFDMTLFAVQRGQGIELRLEYATDLFEAATATRMLDGVVALLAAATANPDVPISRMPLASPREQAAAVALGAVAGPGVLDATLDQLFAAQAARAPAAVAVSCDGHRLTYAELASEAGRLANRLLASGVEPGSFVGILLDRSIDFVVAVLGILKAGCAYAPLPAEYPAERLAFMIADTQIQLVVTERRLADRLPADGVGTVFMADDEPWRQASSAADAASAAAATVSAESPAYVMYTSGSTGRPKGVVVPHRAVVRLVTGQSYAPFGPEMRTLLLAPTAFDASTFELWAPLLHGGTCSVFPDTHPDLDRLGQVIREERVNCLWLTAGLFNHVIDSSPEILATVGHVLTGGDVLSVPHMRRALSLLPRTQFINGYGPTESTTFACTHLIGRDEAFPHGAVPIGRPLANTSCFIVDDSLQPVPIGVPGELLIGGVGLALCYLNQSGLTAEKFVADPFSPRPGARLYRTGDRCRWLPDGAIEFLGRQDGQVKIRGHRVELGEIEAALASLAGVDQAVVVVCEREQAGGVTQKGLRACVVPRSGATLNVSDLRGDLVRRLPEPMVPGEWLVLESLPLTENGKIDRGGLASAPVVVGPAVAPPPGPEEAAIPRTLLELEIARIWQRLFGRDHIPLTADFFELGGHSLMAAQLVVELEPLLGRRVPIASLFRAPTVESLAELLSGEPWGPAWQSLVPLQPEGSRRPLFMIHGMGGDVFWYQPLARLLAPDQPVYGVRAAARGGRHEDIAQDNETVEAMAADYVREIKALQPEGPYRVGGSSLGGWMAYAVAAALRSQGQHVMLLIFDTYPNCRVPRPAVGLKLLLNVLVQISHLGIHFRRLSALPVHQWLRYIAWRIGRRVAPSMAPAWRSGLEAVQDDPLPSTVFGDRYVRAVARYSARSIEARLELFLERAPLVPSLMAWAQTRFWRGLVQGPMNVHRQSCEHLEMLSSDVLPGLVAIVNDVLADEHRPETTVGGRS